MTRKHRLLFRFIYRETVRLLTLYYLSKPRRHEACCSTIYLGLSLLALLLAGKMLHSPGYAAFLYTLLSISSLTHSILSVELGSQRIHASGYSVFVVHGRQLALGLYFVSAPFVDSSAGGSGGNAGVASGPASWEDKKGGGCGVV